MAFKSYLNGNYDRVFALLWIVFWTCVAIWSEDWPSNKDIMNRLDSLDAKLTDIINKQNQIKEDNQCPNDRIIESNKSNKCDS